MILRFDETVWYMCLALLKLKLVEVKDRISWCPKISIEQHSTSRSDLSNIVNRNYSGNVINHENIKRVLSNRYMTMMNMKKGTRGRRWGHPETISLLEGVIDNALDYASAKGHVDSRIKFFEKESFKKIKEEGGRTSEQMNVRLENLFKEYRKVLKDKATTGNGDTIEQPLDLKVQGSTQMFDLLSDLDSRVHGHGSSLGPKTVRDESGIVYKRPAEVGESGTTTDRGQPPAKKSAPTPKLSEALNFRRMCDNQSDCLENLLNEQMKTNEYLIDIRDGFVNLTNAVENLTQQLIQNHQHNPLIPASFLYSSDTTT